MSATFRMAAKWQRALFFSHAWLVVQLLSVAALGQSYQLPHQGHTPQTTARSYGGWTASPDVRPAVQFDAQQQSGSVQRTSYFPPQSHGDMPPLPQNFAGGERSAADVLPYLPAMPGTGSAAVLPSPTDAGAIRSASQAASQGYTPHQVLPQASSVFPDATPSSRSVPASTAAHSPSAPPPGTGLRGRAPADSGQPTGAPTRHPNEFVTGLPFVTPAVGRYPTSPYNGGLNVPVYQAVAYQGRPVSTSAAGFSTPAQLAVMPQYQQTPYQPAVYSNNPAPGIYPTSYQQCQVLPPPSLPVDGSVGQTYVPPTFTPNWNPNLYSGNNQGFRPLFSMGQENYNVVLGRGIVGQPKAYVPGQYVRNFLRYLSP